MTGYGSGDLDAADPDSSWAEEALLGTDPANADTDGDGVADGVELLEGRDPRVTG